MDEVLKTITEKYGKLERLTGGFTNATYLLQDANPPLVAKVATFSKQDMQNEKNTLQFLEGKRIAPDFIEILAVGTSSILITTYKRGKNGQSILDTGDMNTAKKLFNQMGICLAGVIHSIPFDGRNTSLRKSQPNLKKYGFVPNRLHAESVVYFKKLNFDSATWVLTHGDYGSHNILYGEGGTQFTVIDWEWSEWFHPLVDIAWSCWNTKLHYPNIADSLNQTLMKAYQSINPIQISDEELRAYVIYKLWNILGRVQNADIATQEKWVWRLEWTLNHRII